MSNNDRPQWKHDCEGCVFLGTHQHPAGAELLECDLYFHPSNDPDQRELVARYSDTLQDWAKGSEQIANVGKYCNSGVIEAKRRAIELGLIVDDVPLAVANGCTRLDTVCV